MNNNVIKNHANLNKNNGNNNTINEPTKIYFEDFKKNTFVESNKQNSKIVEEKIYEISKIIQNLDIYNISPVVYFRKEIKFKTTLGGIVSIIILFFIFFFTIILFIEFNSKKTFFVVNQNKLLSHPPSFNITLKYDQIRENEIPLFFFAFNFRLDSKNIVVEDIKKFISLKFQLINIPNSNLTINYNLIPCQNLFIDTLEQLIIPDKEDKIFHCIDKSFLKNIRGDFLYTPYSYIKMEFLRCSADLANKDCEKNQTLIDKFINNFSIEFFYTNTEIKYESNENYPFSSRLLNTEISLSRKLYFKKDIFLEYNDLISKDDIYNPISYGYQNKKYISVNDIRDHVDSFKNSYLSIYIKASKKKNFTYRSYYNVFNFVSLIGGVNKLLLILGAFLVIKVNNHLLLIQIANYIMTIISKNIIRDLKNENYQYYAKKGSADVPNEIITSNDKSTIEAEMFIDTYKYEKNSGLQISASFLIYNSLKKVFCNFSKKKNYLEKNSFTKNTTETIQNLTYKHSENILTKEEISKYEKMNTEYLDNLVFNKVIDKLDIIKILKFCKEKKYLSNIIFGKKMLLLDNIKKNIIDYNELIKINRRNIITKNKFDNKIEKKFLKGIRYMRNKPITDRKIDIQLIKMFKFKKRFMHEFFNKIKFDKFNKK